ncbi:MAG: YdiU family protein [Bacteroidota bacterium]
MKFDIQDKFNKELPADPNKENTRRQVYEACFSFVRPKQPTHPQLIHVSKELAQEIGLEETDLQSEEFLNIFSGKEVYANTDTAPYAMCYGGHQFGNWAGQLGDGRAINLFEIEHAGKPWTLQLKGAGETPYSRTADGLAVLRSSIREHLCSEAMYHLGVPTTRSLSLVLSGDQVLRDMMYDGNAAYEKGAIVCRVAPSFIRFGNFQIFASRKDTDTLKKLVDFTIQHFFPNIEKNSKAGYIEFFRTVAERTMEMVVHWQRVGFVHGVMNTDNMSILGLTIDYGPYGWLEGYDPDWTPNTTDRQMRRYRYGYQPRLALWNLYQLGNAIYPLIEEVKPLEKILKDYQTNYQQAYRKMMFEKLGLEKAADNENGIITELLEALQQSETDMTIFFRNLANFSKATKVESEDDFLKIIEDAFYEPEDIEGDILEKWIAWFDQYQQLLAKENLSDEARQKKMNAVNPKYVLRNYMAQLAIDAANDGDYGLLEQLHELLKKPYDEQPDMQKWFAKRPEWARHKVGCSMLSCSS